VTNNVGLEIDEYCQEREREYFSMTSANTLLHNFKAAVVSEENKEARGEDRYR